MLQSNQVLSFFQACERGDWSQRELAEFYRVEAALTKSGVGISTDRGLTDEGEPWFVFFRQDDEEVIIHFARIGGEYVVASNFTEAVARGRNFQTLVRELLDSHPYVLPKQHSSRSTVFLHPATLLAALVVTGYVKSSELNATADDGSRPEKSFGWFLNRHDLAATYSAIVIASVWDSLAIDSSVSKPSDDLASLDHARPAHGEHGPDIVQAVAGDSLLQNIQAFHAMDDRFVLTAVALDLDGQDAVRDVKEPAIAGLVANPSGLHPESSHHDNAAASSAHDVRAENALDSKLADFRPPQGDGFPIAASEQVERTVTHNPVSSSAPSNPTPDHPAPQQVSTAPTTAIAHSDTTITPDNLSSGSHGEETIHPFILDVTSLSDAIQAPASDLQPEVTSTVEPAAQVNYAALPGDVTANALEPSGPMQDATITPDDLSSAVHVEDTSQPLILDVTSLSDAIQAPASDLQPEVTSTVEPAAQVNYAAPPGDVTANALEPSGLMQAFDHRAQHDLEHLGRAESSGASPSHHAAPSGPMQDATPDNLSSAVHVEDTSQPLILDVTSLSDAIQAPASDLQPEVTSTVEPAAQVNYAALPGDVTANALEPSGPMQAFDHQAQRDLEHLGRADSSGASPSHHAAPSGPMQDATITPDNLSSAVHVEDTSQPLILDVTSLPDAIQAPASDLQPEVTSTVEPAAQVDKVATTGEPAAQVNYAALPGDVTTNLFEPSGPMQAFDHQAQRDLEHLGRAESSGASPSHHAAPSGPMQAFDHQAQHDLEAGMSDGSTLGIVGIDVHHSATALT